MNESNGFDIITHTDVVRCFLKHSDKESSTLEFKVDIPKNDQISKTVIAFANGLGGRIIIGIDDQGTIVGIDEERAESLLENLDKMIFESCSPKIIPHIYLQRLGNLLTLIVEVSTGMSRPYYLKSLGPQEGVFVRVGRSTVRADYETIQELQWKSRGISYDCVPEFQARFDLISADKFARFLKMRRIGHRSNRPTQELYRNYKVCVEERGELIPTKGGILLFANNPQEYISESFIICSHFKGTSGRDAISSIDCTGDLFEQFEMAWDFIISKIPVRFEEIRKKRIEHYEVPLVAIREILVNAIVHRDYRINGPIKIAIYQDRIEFFSPGLFPGVINPKDIGNGVTYIRNQMITKCFREVGHIEKLGSGFKTTLDEYEKEGLNPPIVFEGDGFVKVILPRTKIEELSEKGHIESDFMALFDILGEVSISDLSSRSSLSRATIGRKLKELEKLKVIKRKGFGKNTRYRKN